MNKLTYLILIFLNLAAGLRAQDIKSWAENQKPILFEKLFVHVDRDFYAPGDKIWMKVYEVNGLTNKLNSNFRNVFVQLINEKGAVVRDQILFSANGVAHGDFKTAKLPRGIYTIRAFTKYLENYGEDACFHKKIWITNSVGSVDLSGNDQIDYSKVEIAFLPEGGNLVLNTLNTIAFKAVNTDGRGVFISGKIVNSRNDTLTSFAAGYLGMGKFLMMPADGETYFATIDQLPGKKIELPIAHRSGICLNFKENGTTAQFGLFANMKLNRHPAFYFVASHKGVVLFYRRIEMTSFSQPVNLSKSLFPKGISKISLLDSTLTPFAERLIFIDDGMNSNIRLSVNKNTFRTRDSVAVALHPAISPDDSVNSTLSVSVVNTNYLLGNGRGQTIRSYLLLDSDLKGAVESPDSYFTDDTQMNSSEKLDLLMMVQGWKSYSWDDLEEKPQASLDDWNDAGINLRGYVEKLLHDSPVTDGEVVLGPAGANFLFLKTKTDSTGHFEFKQIYLRDSTQVMLNARNRSGSRNTEIRLDPVFKLESAVSPDLLQRKTFNPELSLKFTQDNSYRRMKEMGFSPEKGSILLSEVEVTKDRIPKGATQFKIYQEPDNTMKITRDDYSYDNVIDYLQGKVAGLTVTGDQISIRGGGTPLFLIDGVEIEDIPPGSGSALQEIKNLHMNEIEHIDILKSGMNMAMFGSKGANGVIAIYRTSGDYTEDIKRYIRGRLTERIRGFNRPSKFYSPRYTLANLKDPAPDYRPTLYWNPEVSFKDGEAIFGFFTSDELASYRILVEGITKNGKICFGESEFTVTERQ